MSTRIYCDQCGTETSKRKALRFSLSGYSANRTSMGQLNAIETDKTGGTIYSARRYLTQDMYRDTVTLALLRWIAHLEQFSQTNQTKEDA